MKLLGYKMRIAFILHNTIQNIAKLLPQTDKYNKSSIYRIESLGCPLNYIGQTGKTFHIRYKDHIQTIRNIKNS
jgi:hypothetical protein